MQVPAGTSAVGARRRVRLAAVAAAVVALDQLSKSWAVAVLDDRSIELIGSSVRFDLVHNQGSAFSVITGWAPVLALLALALVVFIVRMSRHESDPWLLVALSLVLGGALGNLADRVFRDPGWFRGAVIDFIDVGAWPTFNVADSAITVGAVLLFLRGWRTTSDHEQREDHG